MGGCRSFVGTLLKWLAFYRLKIEDNKLGKNETQDIHTRSEYADFSLRCRRTGLQSGK